MKRINVEEYYRKYFDLYNENVTVEMMDGFRPNKNWLVLEAIPPAPDAVSSYVARQKLAVTGLKRSREPVVFRVLAAGDGCSYVKDDLVLSTYLAGDKFTDSPICFVPEEQIIGKWGVGIEREAKEIG